MSKYLKNLTDEDFKRAFKKVKENFKNTRNGRPKKFFLSAEYVSTDTVYEYMKEQNEFVLNRIKEERERAWKFLNDEEEARKAGWYDKKHQEQKLFEWAEKAYPKINVDYFETEFEELVLKEKR